jgi:chromosomal replication initiation ATPase DnaA
MKPESIPEILKKFEDNTDRAIMIDGRWGIGKTYQLLAHISGQSRKEKRKKKYVYVSMFGKETIDDIHTELYAKMNPGRIIIGKIVFHRHAPPLFFVFSIA